MQAWNGADMLAFHGFVKSDMLCGDHSFGYTIRNLLVEHAMRNTPVPPDPWRAASAQYNAVCMECFID